MKLRLLFLLAAAALAASPAAGQTIKSLGYNTTNGNIVAATNVTFTNSLGFATNARAATRTNLGATTVGNSVFTATNGAAAATAIGLGWAALTNPQSSLYSGTATQLLGYVAETNPSSPGLTGFNVLAYTNTNTLVIPANLLIGEDAVPAPRNPRNVTVNGSVTIQYPYSSLTTIYANNSITATDGSTYTNTLVTYSSNAATFATNVSVAGSLTTTGNATLNGSGNLAPSQTADSKSSLMTRGLLYAAQTDDASGDLVFPGGFIMSGTGALAQAHLTAGNVALITTNTNTMAGAYFADSFWTHKDFSGSSVPSDKVLDLALKGIILRMETNQNYVLRVAIGVGTPTRTPPPAGSDALSSRGWGVNFFYNGTNYVYQPFWYTTNYNTGTAVAISNMSTAFSQWTASVFTMRLRQETNGDIKFWINNGLNSRLGSTPSFQTNVVWGASTFGGRSLAIEAAAATNAAPAAQVRIGYRVGYLKYEQ